MPGTSQVVGALRIGGAQFLVFLVATVNIRMVASGSYVGTVASDAALLWLGFFVTKNVAKSETRLDHAAYVVGGVAGSILGLFFTR